MVGRTAADGGITADFGAGGINWLVSRSAYSLSTANRQLGKSGARAGNAMGQGGS